MQHNRTVNIGQFKTSEINNSFRSSIEEKVQNKRKTKMKTVSDEQVRSFLKLLNMSTRELNFRKRVRGRIESNNIWKIWKMLILSRNMLLSIPGFGKESIREFYRKRNEVGLLGNSHYCFYNEFWEWANETVGFPRKATPEERLRFVSWLENWPSLEQAARKYLEENP